MPMYLRHAPSSAIGAPSFYAVNVLKNFMDFIVQIICLRAPTLHDTVLWAPSDATKCMEQIILLLMRPHIIVSAIY